MLSSRGARAAPLVCAFAIAAAGATTAAAKPSATTTTATTTTTTKSKATSSKTSRTKSKATSSKTSKTKSKTSKSTKSKPKAKAKHHDTGTHRADNMPANWTWPPSRPMLASGTQCLAKLDELGVVYKRAGAVDRIVTPVTVPGMKLGGLKLTSIWRKGPFVMDCELALALQTYGPTLTAVGVKELQFSRIWGYTQVRVGGVTKPYLSRHALGLAIDVYAFVDEGGNKSVVETAYPQNDPFLINIENAVNASGGFRLCLTPKNDPISHHDHFHLEAAVMYPAAPPPRVSAREASPRRH